MTTYWTDPDNNLEYEVEFTVCSDVDAGGNLIPVIDEVVTMTSADEILADKNQPVDFSKQENKEWFERHSKSIFDACNERIEEDL